MSLAKWLARAGEFAKANKKPLMAAAAVPAAYGAYELAEPKIDDFMTDQAINSMIRSGKRAIADTADYAEKHPYIASGLLGASGLAGAKLGESNFADLFNSVAPARIPQRNRRQR